MLEGKALVVAIMMLTAAPIAATDSGQIFIADVRDSFEDMIAGSEPLPAAEDPKRDEVFDDALEKCLTLEEWEKFDLESKEDYAKDEVKESESKKETAKKEDRSRNDDGVDNDCLLESEYRQIVESTKVSSPEEDSCYYLEDVKEEMVHDKKDWDREDKEDWDKEDTWSEEFEVLLEACEEGDEESCDELAAIREDREKDREEESDEDREREDEEESEEREEGSRSGDETESEEESEDDSEKDEFDEELMAEMEELKIACEDGDDESCQELRVMMTELMEEKNDDIQLIIGDDGVVYYEDKDRKGWDNEGKDWDEACLTTEEWKEVFEKRNDRNKKDFDMSEIIMSLSSMDDEEVSEIKEKLEMSDEEWDAMMVKLESRNMTEEDWDMIMEKMRVLWEDEREDDRKEKGPHRDAIVREMLADFEAACEEGNEEACEDLEVMLSELEEREGGCDKEREEEDESNEEEDREDESEEDDSNEDESEE